MITRAVIGIGNPLRGDDGVGPAVIDALRREERPCCAMPAGVDTIVLDGEATRLADAMGRHNAVVLVDCAAGGGTLAGTIRRFDPLREPLPDEPRPTSTHAAGVALALRLAEALGRMPRHLVVFTVTGAGFAVGAPLSPQVAAAVETLPPMIRAAFAQEAVAAGPTKSSAPLIVRRTAVPGRAPRSRRRRRAVPR